MASFVTFEDSYRSKCFRFSSTLFSSKRTDQGWTGVGVGSIIHGKDVDESIILKLRGGCRRLSAYHMSRAVADTRASYLAGNINSDCSATDQPTFSDIALTVGLPCLALLSDLRRLFTICSLHSFAFRSTRSCHEPRGLLSVHNLGHKLRRIHLYRQLQANYRLHTGVEKHGLLLCASHSFFLS